MLRIAAIALAVALVALVASQLVLPPLAERRVKGDLAEVGDVQAVRVRAFPALRLLAGRADSVDVRFDAATSGTGQLGDLLERTRKVDEVDAAVASLALGPLALREGRLTKRGDTLEARADLTDAALQAALPAGLGLRPVASADGQLELEATAGLLGLSATVRARLAVREGALVVAPQDIPFGGLATVTVFSDPRVVVTGVSARRGEGGYALAVAARLSG